MKNAFSFHSKLMTFLALSLGALFYCPAATPEGEIDYSVALEQLDKRISLLEAVDIMCGPVTINKVHLGNQRTCIHVQPGQTVECSLHYHLDASQQKLLDKHHLIVGLEGVGAETCLVHLYGVWNSKGTKNFKLVAPLQEGDYEVKAAYYAGDKCEDAFNSWNVLKLEPANSATIGILRVRNGF